MKVKFLRSIIAGGEHREAYATAELDDIEAILLVRAGDCVEFKGDAPLKESPKVETATAKQPGKEKAEKK